MPTPIDSRPDSEKRTPPCEHEWGFEPMEMSTNLCDKKPVVCGKCLKRRAWRKTDLGKLPTHNHLSKRVQHV